MLVSKKHKALVLRLKDPQRVIEVIPKAKAFEYNGKQFVAVKHGPHESRILRNLGLTVPSPILHYYNWPGRFPPFGAQREAAAFLSLNARGFNLSDMGTGKTLATLWAYDYLRASGVLRRALVVTPLSTLERTWADEVFQHFPHLVTCVLHGTRDKRLKLLNTDSDLYLINHDGIKVNGIVEALAKRDDIDLIVVDEIAQIGRHAGTERFKALNTIANKQVPREVWGLTGTPTPNAPTDAWAQCRIVSPARVTPYFSKFRDQVMRQISQFTWIPRVDAATTVQEVMQPAVRFSREECVDLPPCIFQYRSTELTAPQKAAYKDMVAKLRAEVDAGQILAVNEAVKAGKLFQIVCGVAYDAKGEELTIDATPRLNVVEEVVRDAGTKIIVFAPFVSAVKLVAAHLRDAGHSVECIYGEVSKSDRDRIFHSFQREQDPKVIVAQPAAMSHGLTLTAASTIIWYAPIASNDIFEQANARIVRPGQKHTQFVVMIEGSEIERRCYQRLKDKQRVQGLLLDLVREHREGPGQEGLTVLA
jgi:SNF2 family DNA or RNA helicase